MPKLKQPLSDRQYLTRSGLACPSCHRNGVTGEIPEVRDGPDQLYRPCHCQACGATWTETFRMTGYEQLKLADGTPVIRTASQTGRL